MALIAHNPFFIQSANNLRKVRMSGKADSTKIAGHYAGNQRGFEWFSLQGILPLVGERHLHFAGRKL